jgi:hypothetical protein
MKKLFLPLFILLLTGCALAQQVAGDTQFATILPAFNGSILQYSFPVTPFGGWVENGNAKKFAFGGTDVAQLETVDGDTELYLVDTHDVCGPKFGAVGKCTFLGSLTPGTWSVQTLNGADGTYQHVQGEFSGSFQDAKGNVFLYVPVLLSFDTFPTQPQGAVNWPSHGGVTVVLKLNGGGGR